MESHVPSSPLEMTLTIHLLEPNLQKAAVNCYLVPLGSGCLVQLICEEHLKPPPPPSHTSSLWYTPTENVFSLWWDWDKRRVGFCQVSVGPLVVSVHPEQEAAEELGFSTTRQSGQAAQTRSSSSNILRVHRTKLSVFIPHSLWGLRKTL